MKEKTDTFLSKLNKQNFDANLLELVIFYCYCGCLPLRFDLKSLQTQSPAATAIASTSASAQSDSSTVHELLSLGDEARLNSLVQFLKEFDEMNDLNNLLSVYINNFSFKLSRFSIKKISQALKKKS